MMNKLPFSEKLHRYITNIRSYYNNLLIKYIKKEKKFNEKMKFNLKKKMNVQFCKISTFSFVIFIDERSFVRRQTVSISKYIFTINTPIIQYLICPMWKNIIIYEKLKSEL